VERKPFDWKKNKRGKKARYKEFDRFVTSFLYACVTLREREREREDA